jgi:hypothetical protein
MASTWPVYRYQAVRIQGKGTVGAIAYFATRQKQREAIKSGEFAPIRSTVARRAMKTLRAATTVTLGG